MASIVFSHFPSLSEPDEAMIRALFEKSLEKIRRSHAEARMRVVWKVLEEKGVKRKREIRVHVVAPGMRLEASDASYNPVLSAKTVCSKLDNELAHRAKKA